MHYAFSTCAYQVYDKVKILNLPMFDTIVNSLRNEIQPRSFGVLVSHDVFRLVTSERLFSLVPLSLWGTTTRPVTAPGDFGGGCAAVVAIRARGAFIAGAAGISWWVQPPRARFRMHVRVGVFPAVSFVALASDC